jgi:hypothetical protein
MATSKKDNGTEPTPGTQGESSQRPQTLMQRLSLGFPSFKINRGAGSNSKRPETAPADPKLTCDKSRRRGGLSDRQQLIIPRLEIPKLSDSDSDCPYDPSSYHSIPSIEQGGCTCCGLRPPSRASSRSCSHCRSRTPLSHLASNFRCRRGRTRKSPATEGSLARLLESSESPEESPRIVPGAIVARRIGNPPRRSSLPGGIVPSYSTSRLPSHQSHTKHDSHSGALQPGSQDVRPQSPKLHHLHCLPNAKSHPYVHKHEVDMHLAALRAGSPSPLRQPVERETRMFADLREPYQDFSRTVFYGTSTHWGPNRPGGGSHLAPRSGPHYTSGIVECVGNVIIEEERRGGAAAWEREVARSQVYRRQSPRTPKPDSDSSHGQQLLLKGGGDDIPQLRGGSVGSIGFRLKRWILTCHGPCPSHYAYDSDSDENLPPSRVPAPERLARALRSSRSRATLPVNIVRDSAQSSLANSSTTPSVESDTAASRNSFASSIHQTVPPTHALPIPTLRGGSGSAIRLPPTLYWLAGGRGKPVTIGSWNTQKGKKRRSGWLGMAMYGARAGAEYDVGGDEGESGSSNGSAREVKSESVKSTGATVRSSSQASAKATIGSEKDGEGSNGSGSASSEGSGESRDATPGDEHRNIVVNRCSFYPRHCF